MRYIFTEHANGELNRSNLAAPKEERVLQDLIQRHSVLISMPDEELLLIQREAGASGTEIHGERWSLDHLFAARDAVPVLVEVKRATDSRIRREVVGQMLDYAANGSAYWTAETMENAFRKTCDLRGVDPDEALNEFIAAGQEPEEFWVQMEANLRAGRLKLRFVADRIPVELSRVVKFLNAHTDIEVLAVELGYYQGESGQTVIVPNIIGEGETASGRIRQKREPNPLLAEILEAFRRRPCQLSPTGTGTRNYVQLGFGDPKRHFEWIIKKRDGELEIAIHFEGKDREVNLSDARAVEPKLKELSLKLGLPMRISSWGRNWATAGLIMSLAEAESDAGAERAADAMVALVEATLDDVRKMA